MKGPQVGMAIQDYTTPNSKRLPDESTYILKGMSFLMAGYEIEKYTQFSISVPLVWLSSLRLAGVL
jgi:hypothetical protein